MKVSRMIQLLEKIKENHGDCEVSASWEDDEMFFNIKKVTYTHNCINGPVDDEGKPFYHIKANSCVLKLAEK